MEYVLLILSFLLLIIGFLGSFLPIIPGTPLSWSGLLCLYLIKGIPINYTLLGLTLLFVVAISVLDYIIPAQGTKRFGGSKYGIWGTNIGLVIGIFIPIPLGFIFCPFLGALFGEILYDYSDINRALKAAFGSFIGFLLGTFIKIVTCLVCFIFCCYKVYQYWYIWF